MNHSEHAVVFGDNERCATRPRDRVRETGNTLGEFASSPPHILAHRTGRGVSYLSTIDIDAAHAGLSREGNELSFVVGDFPAAETVPILCQHDDGPAFR